MIHKRIALIAGVLTVAMPALAPGASAQATTPDTAGGRYMFSKTPDGFVRLDTQSGEVAQCSQREVGLA